MKNLNNKYIVLEVANPNYGTEYVITYKDNFKMTPYCECYDEYGQNNCTVGCGCDEDEYGEDAGHYEINAWNYSNGSNMRTISLEENCGFEEVSEELAKKIFSEMPDIPYMDGATETIETENYSFHFSRYADNPWICTVS